jgi:alkylation response protein AidB-like acyl-CoA dehydrogenase
VAISALLDRSDTRAALHRHDIDRTFPADVVAQLHDLGLGELLAGEGEGPESIATYFHRQALLERVSAASGSLGIVVGVNALSLGTLQMGAEDALRARVLADVRAGARCSLVLTEWNHGSDLRATETRATPGTLAADGVFCPSTDPPTHYRIDGTKDLINGGSTNEYLLTVARVEGGDHRGGLTLFAIRRDQTVRVERRWTTLPAPAADICSIAFSGTIVPAASVIGEVGGALRLIMQNMARARGGVGALAVGTTHRAMALTQVYLDERTVHGRPLHAFPALVEHMATLEALDLAIACLANKVAALVSTPAIDPAYYTAVAKLSCCTWAEKAVDEGRRVFSARALVEQEPYTRLVRDVLLYSVFDGTRHVILAQICKYAKRLVDDLDADGAHHAHHALRAAYAAEPTPWSALPVPNLSRPTVLPLAAHLRWLASTATRCAPAAAAVAEIGRRLCTAMAQRVADGGWGDQAVAFAAGEAAAHLETAAAMLELGHAPCRHALGIADKHASRDHDDLLVTLGLATLGQAAANLILRVDPSAAQTLANPVGALARARAQALTALQQTFPRSSAPRS